MNPFHRRQRTQPTQSRSVQHGYTLLASIGLALLALVLVYSSGTARSEQATDTALPSDQVRVVRIRVASLDEGRQLAALDLDMLEARDGNDLFALVTADEQADLLARGWDVRIDTEQTALLQQQVRLQTFRGGYRTVEEMEQELQTMATTYPTLTRLVDIGDSWERQQPGGAAGYNLWALRMTNQLITGTKPIFVLMAAVHAREITTPEIAMRFIDYLLTNYGRDAETTWLLNEHEIVVLPMANPDGHKLAEEGYFQRKNTNTSYGGDCPDPPRMSSHFGVDLNRNFSFLWGTIVDPGTNPCSAVFPGGSAASEPETQAVEAFVRSLYPTQSRPDESRAAPITTTGVLISLHSYSDLVLWPWGYTPDPAPNADGLEQLGRRMAAFNGYQPSQAIGLYPTSGTTDEWAYGELGIPAYTFEIGPVSGPCGFFMPPYSCLDEGRGGAFWPRNLPALLYAARVTHAPYVQPAGPELRVEALSLVSDTTTLTLTMALTSTDEPFSATEVYIGASPWYSGTLLPLQSLGTRTDAEAQEWGVVTSTTVITSACAERAREVEQRATCLTVVETGDTRNTGINPRATVPVLLVRGRDATGAWGPFRAVWAQSFAPPVQHSVWLPLLVR